MRRSPLRRSLDRAGWLLASIPLLAGTGAPADAAGCAQYDVARPVGRVPAELEELSGLAASRRHPGIFWAHNDSGHVLVLHAMRADGTIVARFPLRGATARDPEDVAVGPCAPGDPRSCIYLGDIGDNRAERARVAILRVPEPAALAGGPLAAQALPFRYPDGSRNAEALVVDPRTARLFVITKTLVSLGDVYRLDGLGTRAGGRAVRLGQLRRGRDFDAFTTAADLHPRGDRLLLRTYGRVWELRSPGARTLEAVLAAEPVEVPGAPQPQAEAVAYDGDGLGYLLGSETAGSTIHHAGCRAPAGAPRP